MLKNTQLVLIALTASLSYLPFNAQASCNDFRVTVQNTSSNVWTIGNINVIQGQLLISPANTIPANQSVDIDFSSSWMHGPDVYITIINGNSAELLHAKQNYCLFEAGNINAWSLPGKYLAHTNDTIGSYKTSSAGKSLFTIHN
jgi:hypothetical protein